MVTQQHIEYYIECAKRELGTRASEQWVLELEAYLRDYSRTWPEMTKD